MNEMEHEAERGGIEVSGLVADVLGLDVGAIPRVIEREAEQRSELVFVSEAEAGGVVELDRAEAFQRLVARGRQVSREPADDVVLFVLLGESDARRADQRRRDDDEAQKPTHLAHLAALLPKCTGYSLLESVRLYTDPSAPVNYRPALFAR